MEKAQPAVMGKFGERERTQGMTEKDGQLGGNQRTHGDSEQEKRGVPGKEIEQHGDASHNLDPADERSQQMGIGHADRHKPAHAQIAGP